jgi:hypothetical protein
VPEGARIITEKSFAGGNLLAGNLRLNLPNRLIVSCDLVDLFPSANTSCFLVWDATRREAPPESLQAWMPKTALAKAGEGQPQYFTAVYRHQPSKQLRLGLLRIH